MNEFYIKNELNSEQLFYVLDNWVDFIKKTGIDYAKISITGGEPILKQDFFPLLEKVQDYKNQGIINNVCVMSNGSTLTDDVLQKYKELGVDSIQISVEGTEKCNDEIRGEGSFQKALKGAEVTIAHKMPLSFSMTLTQQNVHDIEPLARLAARIGVGGMGIGRLIPEGRGKQMQDLMLSPVQVLQLYRQLEGINMRLANENIRLRVGLHCSDSLYTTINPRFQTHGCSTPYDVFTVLPNGDVVPCRRLPIVAGNILKQTFLEVYYSSKVYQQLKNLENMHPSCKSCKFMSSCKGSGKCAANGWFGTPYAPDPQCWHLGDKLPLFECKDRDEDKVTYSTIYATNVRMDLKPVDLDELGREKKEIDLADMAEVKDGDHIYFRVTENDLNDETGRKITTYLEELEKKGIKARIVKPLPPCVFGANHKEFFERFNIPQTCSECLNLFKLDGNTIKLCNGKSGPELKYMNNRQQIGEYFELIRKKNTRKPETCKRCRYNLRNQCSLVYCNDW